MIMEALLEGGWSNPEEEAKDKQSDMDDSSENSLVASILNKPPSDDNQMVQSALNSQSVSSQFCSESLKLVARGLHTLCVHVWDL